MVADSEAYIREMRDYQPELATTTFSNDLMLHDAAHDLHLSFRGRGHTAGDVVVFCPQKKVIATGDLLHGALPYLGDAWPREWPLTLVAVAQFDFLHAAGGHGPVQPAKKVLYMKRDYLEELAEEVSKGKQRGRTAADLQNAVTPATLKSLSGPYREWLLTVFGAGSRAPGITPETALAASVRSNIADMYKALDRT
jgi:hypothetical protein